MDINHPDLSAYAERLTSSESDLLKKINRETHVRLLKPRMLSGHLQGRLLSLLSFMIKPRYIVEIGTFTGYSAICLAEGLQRGGRLITIDRNEELEQMVLNNFNAAGLTDIIEFRIGKAADLIPSLDEGIDLVFLDADKEQYSTYYDLVFDKVNAGGFILADNVLWNGKVLDAKPDKDTRAIQAFNEKIQADERVENVLLPVRDGMMIVRKR